MSASNLSRLAFYGALLAASVARPAFVRAQSPTIVPLGGTLNFATIMPGQPAVTIAPWQSGLAGSRSPMGRMAPVFEITGAPNATIEVRFPSLPATIENGNGAGTLAVSGYTARFNTANGPAGAIAITPSSAWTQVTLNASGKGWVSLGATLTTAGATQPKGSYAWGEGGRIEVR